MKRSKTELALIAVSILFIGIMLVIPLIAVLVNSLQQGVAFYINALTTEYVLSALEVTLLATVIAVVLIPFSAWLLPGR